MCGPLVSLPQRFYANAQRGQYRDNMQQLVPGDALPQRHSSRH
jgi:hypothetical protein